MEVRKIGKEFLEEIEKIGSLTCAFCDRQAKYNIVHKNHTIVSVCHFHKEKGLEIAKQVMEK